MARTTPPRDPVDGRGPVLDQRHPLHWSGIPRRVLVVDPFPHPGRRWTIVAGRYRHHRTEQHSSVRNQLRLRPGHLVAGLPRLHQHWHPYRSRRRGAATAHPGAHFPAATRQQLLQPLPLACPTARYRNSRTPRSGASARATVNTIGCRPLASSYRGDDDLAATHRQYLFTAGRLVGTSEQSRVLLAFNKCLDAVSEVSACRKGERARFEIRTSSSAALGGPFKSRVGHC